MPPPFPPEARPSVPIAFCGSRGDKITAVQAKKLAQQLAAAATPFIANALAGRDGSAEPVTHVARFKRKGISDDDIVVSFTVTREPR